MYVYKVSQPVHNCKVLRTTRPSCALRWLHNLSILIGMACNASTAWHVILDDVITRVTDALCASAHAVLLKYMQRYYLGK